ncbi:MAG: hypothetical protein WCK59_03625 [Candidatus Falkowbacteria bacterium]
MKKFVIILILLLSFSLEASAASNCQIECFRYDPVCGVNGQTYGCGLPELNCHGVKLAYLGACKINSCLLSDQQSKKLCATLTEKNAFEKYLSDNISKLSPKKAVLGGTFYVTKIVWQPSRIALVSYEDGHVAFTAQTKIAVTYKNGQIKQIKTVFFNILSDK